MVAAVVHDVEHSSDESDRTSRQQRDAMRPLGPFATGELVRPRHRSPNRTAPQGHGRQRTGNAPRALLRRVPRGTCGSRPTGTRPSAADRCCIACGIRQDIRLARPTAGHRRHDDHRVVELTGQLRKCHRRGLTPACSLPRNAGPCVHRCHRCAARHLRERPARAPGVRRAVPGRRAARRPDVGDQLRPAGRGQPAPGASRHHARLADVGADRVPVVVHRRAPRGGPSHRDRDRPPRATSVAAARRVGRARRAARTQPDHRRRAARTDRARRSRRSTGTISTSSSTRSR